MVKWDRCRPLRLFIISQSKEQGQMSKLNHHEVIMSLGEEAIPVQRVMLSADKPATTAILVIIIIIIITVISIISIIVNLTLIVTIVIIVNKSLSKSTTTKSKKQPSFIIFTLLY